LTNKISIRGGGGFLAYLLWRRGIFGIFAVAEGDFWHVLDVDFAT